MNKDLTIRLGIETDAETLANFNISMARETEGRELDFEIVLAGVKNMLADPRRGFYLTAELEGEIVGSLMITLEWSDWNNGWYWWIQSVYVTPEYRRRGIYSELYKAVKVKASQEGDVRGLRLYAEKENTAAHDVYRKRGMAETAYWIFEERIE